MGDEHLCFQPDCPIYIWNLLIYYLCLLEARMMGTNSWGVPVSRSRECKLHCNPSLCDLGLPRAVKLNWNEIFQPLRDLCTHWDVHMCRHGNHIHIHTYTSVHPHPHICTYMCVHTYVRCTSVCTNMAYTLTHVHEHTHTYTIPYATMLEAADYWGLLTQKWQWLGPWAMGPDGISHLLSAVWPGTGCLTSLGYFRKED